MDQWYLKEADMVPLLHHGTELDKVKRWSLVLWSMDIPHRIFEQEDGWNILVPEDMVTEADLQIRLYEQENPSTSKEETGRGVSRPVRYLSRTIWSLLLVASGMSVALRPEFMGKLMAIGACDSSRIFEGQWWRTITSLFLHVDPSHFLSNIVIGGFFLVFVFGETGPGLGWLLIIVSSGLANLLNSWLQGPEHVSVGFSTGVFSGIGGLCAIRAIGQEGLNPRASLNVFLAGLALLGMLGYGKGRVDIGSHLFGFIMGVVSFMVVAPWLRAYRRWRFFREVDTFLLALALLIVVLCWYCAFVYGYVKR